MTPGLPPPPRPHNWLFDSHPFLATFKKGGTRTGGDNKAFIQTPKLLLFKYLPHYLFRKHDISELEDDDATKLLPWKAQIKVARLLVVARAHTHTSIKHEGDDARRIRKSTRPSSLPFASMTFTWTTPRNGCIKSRAFWITQLLGKQQPPIEAPMTRITGRIIIPFLPPLSENPWNTTKGFNNIDVSQRRRPPHTLRASVKVNDLGKRAPR